MSRMYVYIFLALFQVHTCLYFIAPSGHGLKPLDVEFMRRLHDKVNIIPVIAKADTLTPDECQHLKKQVMVITKMLKFCNGQDTENFVFL